MIEIRRAMHIDGPAWLRLREALWPDEEVAADVELYFAGKLDTLAEVLVAVDGFGELVGFAELSIRRYAEGCLTDRVAYLEGWYVVPEKRRHGVGRGLIAAAEAWGRSQGCTEFASDALLDNEISAAAHNALGFEEVEQIRCFKKMLA